MSPFGQHLKTVALAFSAEGKYQFYPKLTLTYNEDFDDGTLREISHGNYGRSARTVDVLISPLCKPADMCLQFTSASLLSASQTYDHAG